MKKISIFVFMILTLAFSSCSNAGGNKTESGSAAMNEGVVNQLNTEMFKKLVYNNQKTPTEWVYEGSLPCVIDFYADWCRPCKMVAPIMEDLAKEYKGKVVFYRINIDDERELAQMFNIQSIPALLYVPANGKPQMSVGLSGKEDYVQKIQSILLTGTNN
jgi:thioredoxin